MVLISFFKLLGKLTVFMCLLVYVYNILWITYSYAHLYFIWIVWNEKYKLFPASIKDIFF